MKGVFGIVKNRDVFAEAYRDVLAAVPKTPFNHTYPPAQKLNTDS